MLLGIDTGGTFTDAVLFDEDAGVVATAKAATRHDDLTLGIRESVTAVVDDPAAISLVSLSTTLATNALVEGVGSRVALVLIGFGPDDVDRGGLREALGDDPVIFVEGGHDSSGNPLAELDVAHLRSEAARIGATSFAVTGQFGVRNPSHEQAAREALRAMGHAVTCGHELTGKLNGPRRALTCVLNARLIGIITRLCDATRSILTDLGIDAPLMLVRGDGSLVTDTFARERPIETILSGPAASVIGARWLTDIDDAVVVDIGGTTTDIGILIGGEPSLNADGATVGGHQTMVEAIRMYTHGLGGDSEVVVSDRGHPSTLTIGPRRLTPLSRLADDEPDLVHRHLASRSYPPRETDCRFYQRTAEAVSGDLAPREQQLLDDLGSGWIAADRLLTGHLQARALRALVARGLVRSAGFTPTDASLVLGLHTNGDRAAATAAAEFLAQTSDSRGVAVAPDAEAFCRWVVDTLVRRSAEVVLDAAMAEDGLPGASELGLVQRALDGHRGTTRLQIGLDRPVTALGASAATYYAAVATMLGSVATVPEHAGVANAIGAVVGQVRIARTVTVTQPTKGQFKVHHAALPDAFGSVDRARSIGTDQLTEDVRREAVEAGAAEVSVRANWDATTATVDDRDVFVEGTITVVATGRPRLA